MSDPDRIAASVFECRVYLDLSSVAISWQLSLRLVTSRGRAQCFETRNNTVAPASGVRGTSTATPAMGPSFTAICLRNGCPRLRTAIYGAQRLFRGIHRLASSHPRAPATLHARPQPARAPAAPSPGPAACHCDRQTCPQIQPTISFTSAFLVSLGTTDLGCRQLQSRAVVATRCSARPPPSPRRPQASRDTAAPPPGPRHRSARAQLRATSQSGTGLYPVILQREAGSGRHSRGPHPKRRVPIQYDICSHELRQAQRGAQRDPCG